MAESKRNDNSLAIYRTCGLTIAADCLLPGMRAGSDTSPPDLTFRAVEPSRVSQDIPEGLVVVDPVEQAKRFFTATELDDGYLMRFFGVVDVHLNSNLSDVTYRIDPEAKAGLAHVLLSGTFLAFVLALRGTYVMHASAVEVDGHALAFVGHSGMGKSTLALAACTAGANLISEDVLAMTTDDHPSCLPGNTDIRLRRAAVSLADRLPKADRVRTADAREAVKPPLAGDEPVSLSTVVIPRPSRNASELTTERLDPVSALFRLMNFPRVNGLNTPQVVRLQFQSNGAIAKAVPVSIVTVPWGPPFASDLGDRIVELLHM